MSGQSRFQANVRTSVRISKMSRFAPVNAARGDWLHLGKFDVFEKVDIILSMKGNSLFTLFASIVDEKVLQLGKFDVFQKADIILSMKGNSLFTLFASIVDEKVLQLGKFDVFQKADIILSMKRNSLFTLFASIVGEKVDEPPYLDPSSN
ncbi:hypothetical protein AVEN_163437-1 [Araneus ventricosus]|uniref:Uncharacterized protein n=1 Tax=Araneus ventricosus TaxID=182803 RepID=A0A4Y1ZU59_ARAVE|nr:hypothetical protein AVEN_163437-1 [Araneus ventricosus]